MNNTIAIRADANEIIGTGHVMRCLAIAKKIRSSGQKVCFIIADRRSEPMIRSRDFEVICLGSVWNELDSETDTLLSVLRAREIRTILVDTYYVTRPYLTKIQKAARIVYIDDLHKFAYPVDLLINYNIYAEQVRYADIYCGESIPKLALGCRYAPLRDEFCDVKKTVRRGVRDILVTTGGTDRYNVTGALIEGFKRRKGFSDYEFYFVLGQFNENVEMLKKSYGENKKIHFLVNIPNIDHYMKICDVAITAGGTTTYELCACGIPSIMYTLADNQLEIAQFVSKEGLMPVVGDIRENMNQCVEEICSQLRAFHENDSIRYDLSRRMRALCDGYGCKRIVDLISSLNQ